MTKLSLWVSLCSDSDPAMGSSIRLFGRQRSVHQVLGGGFSKSSALFCRIILCRSLLMLRWNLDSCRCDTVEEKRCYSRSTAWDARGVGAVWALWIYSPVAGVQRSAALVLHTLRVGQMRWGAQQVTSWFCFFRILQTLRTLYPKKYRRSSNTLC